VRPVPAIQSVSPVRVDMDFKITLSVPHALQAPSSRVKIAKVFFFFVVLYSLKLACPDPCSSCTGTSSCQTCKPGYGLQNGNQCATCPPGTYLSGQDCLSTPLWITAWVWSLFLACPNTCETCTSDTVCVTCKNGYGLQNNADCATCPIGTFLSGQDCLSMKLF